MINKHGREELVVSIITRVELYSVYSRVMKISDIELEALVLYTLEKTGVTIKELDPDELFKRAMEYANELKLTALDLLHVTAAYLFGCKSFLTFDNDIVEHGETIEKNLGIKINTL